MLLLIDVLEREDLTALDGLNTPALVNLYTLLSDVQRNANDLRKDVADVLLDRVQYNRPYTVNTARSSGPHAASARSRTTRRCSKRSRKLASKSTE